MSRTLISPTEPTALAADLAETGWREVMETQPDGRSETRLVPLTPEEFLHPEEGYHLPNSTFHDRMIGEARAMLTGRYDSHPTVAVFSDLLIRWDIAALKKHSPDLFVVFGIRNKEQDRSSFVVAEEGVRPAFAIEVVSDQYRKQDRETKVEQYERAGILEYVIIDRRTQADGEVDEVLGYRLVAGRYLPIIPDDAGRISCQTIGLWISFLDGRLLMEDVQTGERLQTLKELKQEMSAEIQELKADNQEMSAEIQELKAQLRALQAQLEGRQGSDD